MRKIFLVLTVLSLLSCSGQDTSLNQKIRGEGNRSLSLTAGPEEVWVGVPFTVELRMKGEKDDDVLFPTIEQDFLPEGLILKDCHVDDNQLTLTVSAEKAGSYAIPPLNVLFDNGSGGVELLTRPVEFDVVSLVGEGQEEMADITPALSIGFLTRGQIALAAGLILLIGLFLFWLLYWRRRVKIIPPEPVWTILEREIGLLQNDAALLEGEGDEFYDRSVSLVKKALDGVYGEKTGERTREEFMADLLHSSRYEGDLKAWFVNFFERADMVRFARTGFSRDTALRDLDEAIRFVRRAAEQARSEGEGKA